MIEIVGAVLQLVLMGWKLISARGVEKDQAEKNMINAVSKLRMVSSVAAEIRQASRTAADEIRARHKPTGK